MQLHQAKCLSRQQGAKRRRLCLAPGVCSIALFPMSCVAAAVCQTTGHYLACCVKNSIKVFCHLTSLSLSSIKLSLARICTWSRGPMHDWPAPVKVISPTPASITAYWECMPNTKVQVPDYLGHTPSSHGLLMSAGRNADDEHDSRRCHSKALCNLPQ